MGEQRLKGKVAAVTGAGTGIGSGLALALAAAGADVAIAYHHSEAGAREIAAQIEGLGRRCQVVRADLEQAVAARRFLDTAVEAFGRLDVMVNNSGVTWPKPFLELDDKTWDRTFAINLRGMYVCTQQAARHMIRLGIRGRVINVSSVHAYAAMPGHAHYEGTKGGITMFTKGVAVDLAPYGITVNAVAPGAIEVEKNLRRGEAWTERRAQIEQRIPLGRVGVPADVAPVVVFLASDEAAYVTGETILVDGGLIARMAI
jgi:NAD(P)-dependent dehydrogenase (short-subunit alcohol dehydrogenase family)